jgi:hypothetical protein
VLRDPALENAIRLLLEHTERRQLRLGPVLLVERSEVEALMLGEGLVCDHLGGEEEMLFLPFLLLRFELETLLVETAL